MTHQRKDKIIHFTGTDRQAIPIAEIVPWVVELRVVGQPDIVKIPSQEVVVIGRSDADRNLTPDVDLTSYDAQGLGVSRRHARFIARDNRMMIEDLGSSNGTFVNNQQLTPLDPVRIHEGDVIKWGNLETQIHFVVKPLSTDDTIVGAHHNDFIPLIGNGEHVLILDDDVNVARVLAHIAYRAGFSVTICYSAADAIKHIDQQRPHMVVLELMLTGRNGLDVVEYLRQITPEPYVPIMAVTGATGGYTMGEAMNQGVDLYLGKPVSVEDLILGLGKMKQHTAET